MHPYNAGRGGRQASSKMRQIEDRLFVEEHSARLAGALHKISGLNPLIPYFRHNPAYFSGYPATVKSLSGETRKINANSFLDCIQVFVYFFLCEDYSQERPE